MFRLGISEALILLVMFGVPVGVIILIIAVIRKSSSSRKIAAFIAAIIAVFVAFAHAINQFLLYGISSMFLFSFAFGFVVTFLVVWLSILIITWLWTKLGLGLFIGFAVILAIIGAIIYYTSFGFNQFNSVQPTVRQSTAIPITRTPTRRVTLWQTLTPGHTSPPLTYDKNPEWYASETAAAEAMWGTQSGNSLNNCVPWSDISLVDVGKTTCVYGTIKYSTIHEGVLYLSFSNNPEDFYFVHYGGGWWEDAQNQCHQAKGKIEQLGRSPVMVIDQYDLYYCE